MIPLKLCPRTLFLFKHSEVTLFCRLGSVSCSKFDEKEKYLHPNENENSRTVPLNINEFKALKKSRLFYPENPHLLKVSILGEPNAGKSTLTNSLVKWKVCAVSSKVHTTRRKASAVFVEENKQIVFLDTPGYVSPEQSKKHCLEPSFVMDPRLSVIDVNLIAVVIDIANKWTSNRINENILELLESNKDKKSILILNKVDAVKSKNRLFRFTKILTNGIVDGKPTSDFEKTTDKNKSYAEIIHQEVDETPSEETINETVSSQNEKKPSRGWSHFSRVFMVSALKNDGIDDLREFLLNEAIPHKWLYPDGMVTDQHPWEIATMIVREKLLEYLPNEIPYQVDLIVKKWEMLSSGCPKISIKINCLKPRHKRFIIGPNGKFIAACADKSRKAMREAFRKDVVLHLVVD